MNALTTFAFHDIAVRTQSDENGEPLFCANDVCVALGYANARDAIARHVVSKDVVKRDTPTRGGVQALSYVNESGMYSLIFGSKLETAKEFTHWVTSEVLPAIRKTGAYVSPKAAPKGSPEPSKVDMQELQGFLSVTKMVLEPAGIEGNQLTLALDKVVKAKTGESALQLTGVQLIAPTQERLLNPTELGKPFNVSAHKVNLILERLGYQRKTDNGWEITEKGKAAGGVYLDTGKRHSNGTPIRQVKWPSTFSSVIESAI